MPHGFTSVDSQPEPRDWVGVLDRLAAEPFHVAYKAALRDLLAPRAGHRYLEVGAGTGAHAAAVAAGSGAEVVAVDAARTMAAECRARGLGPVAVADAHDLPFRTDGLDGAWSDRVLQHLADPGRALDELVRVVRPGGRVVLADPDYGTQALDVATGSDVAAKVLRFRADVLLRNGTLAHRHAGLLAARGCADVTVRAHTLVARDPHMADNVMGLRSWADTAADRGYLTPAQAREFERGFDRAVAAGTFTYAVTYFLTAASVH